MSESGADKMMLDPERRMLDRLVDGELSASERRQLLESLDARADGWRDCAVAFLEAQAWQREFRALLAPADEPEGVGVVPRPAEARTRHAPTDARRLGKWAALAAGWLLAFGVGWGLGPGGRPRSAGEMASGGPSGGTPTERIPAEGGQPLVQLGPPDGRDRVDRLGAEPAAPPAAPPAEAGHGGAAGWDDALTLVVQNLDGQLERIHLPLVEAEQLRGAGPQGLPGGLSAALRARLEQQGFDVQARRRYAPMFIEQPGGVVPLVMPVDDAIVTPVRRIVY